MYGCFGGRLDCSIGSIHSCSEYAQLNITLLSNENLGICLRPNTLHTIQKHEAQGVSLGVIPFCKSVKCETSGLKWNLGTHCLRVQVDFLDKSMNFGFGKFISTSNTWDKEGTVVTIESDEMLFFTTDLIWKF